MLWKVPEFSFLPENYLFWRTFSICKNENKIDGMDAIDIKLNSISAKKETSSVCICIVQP